MADQNESYEAKDFGWLVAMSIMFFVLVAIGFWREFSTEWGGYQREFPQLLGHYGKAEDARDFRPGIQQIWIPEDRSDGPLHHAAISATNGLPFFPPRSPSR